MTEQETNTDIDAEDFEDFTDDLSDEALDRGEGRMTAPRPCR